MLSAHTNMTSDEFISQLRTFAIAFGCGPQVIDMIDSLEGIGDRDAEHAKELDDVETEATKTGRQEMHEEIVKAVEKLLEGRELVERATILKCIEGTEP